MAHGVYIFGLQIYNSVSVPKNYENWLAVEKVIEKISCLTFWPTLYMLC